MHVMHMHQFPGRSNESAVLVLQPVSTKNMYISGWQPGVSSDWASYTQAQSWACGPHPGHVLHTDQVELNAKQRATIDKLDTLYM